MNIWQIYCDGASKGNPGKSGGGFTIHQGETKSFILEKSLYFGNLLTNNQAEYLALLSALFYLDSISVQGDVVTVLSDSLLMVRQINGEYKVKNNKIIPIYEAVMFYIKKYTQCIIMHIPREKNHRADHLANEGVKNVEKLPEKLSHIIERVLRISNT